jgi:quinol monooxygenase YgiN
MALRLIVSSRAKPGKGGELLAAFGPRCAEVGAEPGCEPFDLLESGQDPDRLVLLKRWADGAALAAHAEVNRSRPPLAPELRQEGGAEARGLRVQPHALNAT